MAFLVFQRPKIAAQNDGQNVGQSLDFMFVNLEVTESLKYRYLWKVAMLYVKNDFLKIPCKK